MHALIPKQASYFCNIQLFTRALTTSTNFNLVLVSDSGPVDALLTKCKKTKQLSEERGRRDDLHTHLVLTLF